MKVGQKKVKNLTLVVNAVMAFLNFKVLKQKYSTLSPRSADQKSANGSKVLAGGNFFCYFSASSFIRSVRNFAPINWVRLSKIYIVDIFHNHVIQYPTPVSLTYA